MEPNKKIPSFCFKSPRLKLQGNIEWVDGWLDESVTYNTVLSPTQILAIYNQGTPQDLDAYPGIDAETELTALLNQEITEEIDRNFANTIVQDLVPVQPLDLPLGRLHYLDYVYSEPKDPTVYDDGSWSMGNTFEGVIGIKSEIRPHTFI
jgi:hypothetical protein